jgi:lipopolysaccharide transport protein LptA
LNADRAHVPAKTGDSDARIELRGNVEAHSVNAAHFASVSTPALDIDTGRQVATTAEAVQIDLDGHTISGSGMLVDMNNNRVQLQSNVAMRLAANKPSSVKRDRDKEPPLSLPDLFESDSLDIDDNLVLMKKVRSKSEPFISANELRTTSKELTNNQVVLSGAVRVELPKRGMVTADVATITVRDNRIVHIQLTGKPVNFQHQGKNSNEIVRGRGTTVDYDLAEQTLRFSGESWFSKAKYEYTSKALFEYNIETETVHAGQSSIRVAPRSEDSVPADAPTSPDAKP